MGTSQDNAFLAFNRGLVSRLGLARADITRMALSSEISVNWVPRVLGSMMIRPGTGYKGSTAGNAAPRFIDFVFSITQKALIEFTDSLMRVWVSDALVTRAAVATAVTNGGFDADVAGWTDSDEAGGTSIWVAGGYCGFTGNGSAAAIRDQTLAVAAGDQNVEHALRVVVERGPITLRVGSSAAGTDDLISEATLATGVHSLAFTPTGANVYVRFKSTLKRQVLLDSCNIEAAGVMTLPSPYLEASLGLIRYDQSADVVYLGCDGYQQHQIERRSTTSWSLVKYLPPDGPFEVVNIGPVTIAPSGLSGNVTLTASAALFRSTHVGALWSLTSTGQTVEQEATAENTFTSEIRVTGVGTARAFTIVLTGLSATGSTVTLERSLDAPGTWVDVATYVADTTVAYNDTLDNQIAYYRIGVKTGDYAGGTIENRLSYNLGSIRGVARITGFTNSLVVSAEVLTEFGDTAATDIWYEGSWSDYRGWPTADGFHEGRLWWSGRDGIWGSISDAFDSFNPDTEGDSGTIDRTIGSGPVDTINWIVSLQRMLLGAQGAEFSCKSSSLDEPLTPTNFNCKPASSQGSGSVSAVKIDDRAAFVQRGGSRLFELALDANSYEYASEDLCKLAPEVCQPQIVRIAVQRQPDTRIHCVLSDGSVALLVFDSREKVICWVKVLSDGAAGLVEDACVLPGDAGDSEDWVYYVVKRTVNGATVRYLERWATEAAARGGASQTMGDAFVVYSGAATTVITGLSHLEGEQVVVWADGKDVGHDANNDLIYTVAAGKITLAKAASTVCVGLPYTASWKSGKLLQLKSMEGTPFGIKSMIDELTLICADFHPQGLKYGPSLTESEMNSMPLMELGAPVDQDVVVTDYHRQGLTFPGLYSYDARLCLLGKAPRPATVLAAIAHASHSA